MALPLKHSSLSENTCSFPIYTLLPPPLVLFHTNILRFSERTKPFCYLVSSILHIFNIFTRLTQCTAPQISACLCSFQRLFLSLSLGPGSAKSPEACHSRPVRTSTRSSAAGPFPAVTYGFRGNVTKLAHGGICAAWLMRSQYAGCVWIHQLTLVCCCNGCQLCSHVHL